MEIGGSVNEICEMWFREMWICGNEFVKCMGICGNARAGDIHRTDHSAGSWTTQQGSLKENKAPAHGKMEGAPGEINEENGAEILQPTKSFIWSQKSAGKKNVAFGQNIQNTLVG